jgi:hypothetical protein
MNNSGIVENTLARSNILSYSGLKKAINVPLRAANKRAYYYASFQGVIATIKQRKAPLTAFMCHNISRSTILWRHTCHASIIPIRDRPSVPRHFFSRTFFRGWLPLLSGMANIFFRADLPCPAAGARQTR